MSRPLTEKELDEVHFEDDVDSYTVVSNSLAAFNFPEHFKFESHSPLKPCRNKRLLEELRLRRRFRFVHLFDIGGFGVHKTYVLIAHKSKPIPVGAKEWFLERALRHGIETLDSNSRTRSSLLDYDCFTIFPEDRPNVWRETDRYLSRRRTEGADVTRPATNPSEPRLADDAIAYASLSFMYYRCQEGLLLSPKQAAISLRKSLSSDTSDISLIQVSFGTVVRHVDLPLFLHLPAALDRLRRGSNTNTLRCYDLVHGGYVTCRYPFGKASPYGDISYFRSYNPRDGLVRDVRKASVAIYTVCGEFRASRGYIKRKVAFVEDAELNYAQYLQTISRRFPLRMAVVANFSEYEGALAALQENSSYVSLIRRVICTLSQREDDDSQDRLAIGTFRYNWRCHLGLTGKTYLQALQSAKASWMAKSSDAAVNGMYDAELKLKWFIYGDTRLIDYSRWQTLNDHIPLECDADNTGIRRYVFHDTGIRRYVVHDKPRSFSWLFQGDHSLAYLLIPSMPFKLYVSTCLTATLLYNGSEVPHIALMKAIAHISYYSHGPHRKGWTRPRTKDFAASIVLDAFLSRSDKKPTHKCKGGPWRLNDQTSGKISPKDVISAIERPVNAGIGVFYSACLASPEFKRSLLVRYVEDYVSYFPAYFITGSPQTWNEWYRVCLPDGRSPPPPSDSESYGDEFDRVDCDGTEESDDDWDS